MINVAVIGCGYWGPNLIRNLIENTKCTLNTCCDKLPYRLKKIKNKYPFIKTTTNVDDVFRDENIQAVVIATPVSTHYKLAISALESNKHVLVEKPLSASTREAEVLVEKSYQKNKILMVGHTFEYTPAVRFIHNYIKKGELGKVYYCSSTRVNLGIHQRDVSVIWDLAPHDFSIFFYVLKDTPTYISAMGKDFVQKGIPDVAFIDIEFTSGCIAHLQVSWLSPSKLRQLTIVGNKRMLVYDDTQTVEKIKIYDHGVNYKDPETFGEYQLSYRTGNIISPKIDNKEPLQIEIDHFLTSIISGTQPQTNGENGLRVVKALELAEQSLRNNGLSKKF